jgi:hypothetical protein
LPTAILIATIYLLFRGQDTSTLFDQVGVKQTL